MTGYLTQRGRESDGRYCLAVPNREIGNIITERILTLFRSEVKKDGQMAEQFCKALLAKNAKEVEQLLTAYLKKTISIRDTFVRKSIKENFYHGILLGILSYKGSWNVSSNRESGEGSSDILLEVGDTAIGIVLEVTYMNDDALNNEADSKENGEDNSALKRECEAALKQIEDKDYEQSLRQDGMRRILKYGIAFQAKRCCVVIA